MRNNFIYELGWAEFNYDHLYDICTDQVTYESRRLLPHQRRVSDDPYMSSLREKYPFLGSIFNIYYIKNGLPIHIDAKRKCALNIPIRNCEFSDTIWWKSIEEEKLQYDYTKVAHIVENSVEEIYRSTLSVPTLINTTIPHSVVNRGSGVRITISWGITWETDYEQACREFDEFRS